MNNLTNRSARDILSTKYGKYCMICHRRFSKKIKPTYHHIVKLSDGGETTIENGGLLCLDCHTILHSSPENEIYYNEKIHEYKKSRFGR